MGSFLRSIGLKSCLTFNIIVFLLFPSRIVFAEGEAPENPIPINIPTVEVQESNLRVQKLRMWI